MLMYANAHKDKLPNMNPAQTPNDYDATNAVLVALNRDYIKSPADLGPGRLQLRRQRQPPGLQPAPSNFGISAAGPELTAQDWSRLAAAVPEPATVALLLPITQALMRRRRRHQRA